MKNPLIPVAVAFLSGVVAAFLEADLRWVAFPAVLFFIGCFWVWPGFHSKEIQAPVSRADCFLLTLFFALGLFRYWTAVILPKEHIVFTASSQPKEVWITGRICSEVAERFVLSVERIRMEREWRETSGAALVYANPMVPKRTVYAYGDRILVRGEMKLPAGKRNPGGWDFSHYLAAQGVHVLVSVKQKAPFVLLEKGKNFSLRKKIYQWKEFFRQRIHREMEPQREGLIEALLLGERGNIPWELKQSFVLTGTVHLLAVSGLHMGLVLFAVLFSLRFCRIPRRPRFLIAMAGVWLYALIAGGNPSVVRAMVMAEIFLLGKFLGRTSSLLNSLAASVLVILIGNPLEILDLGFWLSVLSVLALAVIYPSFYALIEHYPKFTRETAALFFGSLSVLILLTPLIAGYFNLFSPVTFIANMVLIPLSFVLLSLSFLAALLGIHAGHWLWFDVRLVEIVFVWLTDQLAGIPGGAWYVPRPPVWVSVVYYVFIVFLMARSQPCRRVPRFLVLWLFFLALLFWFPLFPKTSRALQVTFFDVGHGDAALVEFPRGETLLVDTGRQSQPNPFLHPVLRYLHMKGIRFLDGVVLSHADEDHAGGFDFIQKQIRVARLWDNGYSDAAASFYRRSFTSLGRYQTLTQDDCLATLSGVSLECLSPRRDGLERLKQRNDASIVLKLGMGRQSVLLTGDVEGAGIQTLLALNPEKLRCTLLKVPHHGSDLGSGGESFFSRAGPRVALISMAVPNHWNLPSGSTLSQLADCGANVLVTAQTGAVRFCTDGSRYDVISLRQERSLWYTLPIPERRDNDDAQQT